MFQLNSLSRLCILLGGTVLIACAPENREGVEEAQFASYWYQGTAEVNVFDLEQSRYGEVRPGKAVLNFVTENFTQNNDSNTFNVVNSSGNGNTTRIDINMPFFRNQSQNSLNSFNSLKCLKRA